MTSVYEQARQAYRDWVNNGMKRPDIKPVSVPVEKTPTVEKPKVAKPKTDLKKIHKRLVRRESLRNPNNPKSVVKKSELEKTKIFWDSSLPTNQYPILRGLAKVLSLNPDTITVNRAESLRDIVNMAVKSTGLEDETKIYQWVMQKMREGKISGERPEAQLRMFLAMK